MNIKEFFSVGEVVGYFFRKKDPNRPKNFDLKMMHGVNKLSILIFIAAIFLIIIRIILRG